MNNKIVSLFCSLLLFASTLVSCKQDEGTSEKGDNTANLSNPLSIEIVDTSVKNFTAEVSIDPEISCGRYVVAIISQELYDSEIKSDDQAVTYFKEQIKSLGASFGRIDNKYIFEGAGKIKLGETWALEYDTQYVVVAFGVTSSGMVTTKVATAEATTQLEAYKNQMLYVSIEESTVSDIKVSIEMNEDAPFDLYFVAPVSRYDFEEKFGNNKVKVVSALLKSMADGNMDLTQENGVVIFGCSAVVNLGGMWDLQADSEYLIFAFGLDEIGSLQGDIITESAHTKPFEEGLKIALSDVNPAAYNITLHATPEEKVGSYCVFAISTAEVEAGNDSGSDFDLAKYVRDYLYFIGCNFSRPDGQYVFSGEADIDISKMIRLTCSTNYTIIAFGISANGTIETPITHLDTATTSAPIIAGSLNSIEIVDTDSRSFDVTIDKGDFSGYYYVGIYPKEYFESYCKGNEYTLAKMFMEDEISINTDFTIVDNKMIFDKSTTYNTYYSWICRPDTEYIILAFGIDAGGTVSSNVIYTFGKTLPVVMSENVLSLSVHGVTSNSATLVTSPSNDDIYYMGQVKRSIADKMSDQELVDYMETEGGVFFNYLLSKGYDTVKTGPNLEPETEYYAVAYGWDMALSTEIVKVPFTTLANIDAPDIPEEIIIPDAPFGTLSVTDITYDSYHMVARPAVKGSEYVLVTLQAHELTSFTRDEDIVKAVLTMIDNLGTNYDLEGDIYDAWGDYVVPIETDVVQRAGVSAGYNYATIAFGIDKETLQPTTECKIVRYSTPAGAPAAAPAKAKEELPLHSTLRLQVER